MDEQKFNDSILRSKGFTKQPDGSWAKVDPARSTGHGAHPIIQEYEARSALDKRRSDDRHAAGYQKMDVPTGRKFRITVNLRYATNRNGPDPDGSLATLMDCIVRAARRLAEMDKGNSRNDR